MEDYIMNEEIIKDIGEKLTQVFIRNNMITNKYIYVYVYEARKILLLSEKQPDTNWYALVIDKSLCKGLLPKWSIKRIKFIEKLLNEKIDDVCKNILDDELYLTEEQMSKLYVMLKIYN
jgi:hypothetical protein